MNTLLEGAGQSALAGDVSFAELTLKKGEVTEGAVKVEKNEAGEWVLVSSAEFHETYEMKVVADGATYLVDVTDARAEDHHTVTITAGTGIDIPAGSYIVFFADGKYNSVQLDEAIPAGSSKSVSSGTSFKQPYGGTINFGLLSIAIALIVLIFIMNRLGEKREWYYFIPAMAIWALFYYSGIHSTMSGVVIL